MCRSFDGGIHTSRPVLECAKFLTSVVKRDEFHALLFVPRSLFPGLVETKKKRNIIKWYSRRVSFRNDCDELIHERVNGMMEPADSVDLPLRVEGQVRLTCAVLAHIRIQYFDRVVDMPVVKNPIRLSFQSSECAFKQVC